MYSLRMPADSTTRDKRRKNREEKRSRKSKRKKSSKPAQTLLDDVSEHESDLELSKELHSIGGYQSDRQVMAEHMFRSISAVKLKAMLPDILKEIGVEELKDLCVQQLEVMSKKRIKAIIQGEEEISSSDTDEGTSGEEDTIRPTGLVQSEDLLKQRICEEIAAQSEHYDGELLQEILEVQDEEDIEDIVIEQRLEVRKRKRKRSVEDGEISSSESEAGSFVNCDESETGDNQDGLETFVNEDIVNSNVVNEGTKDTTVMNEDSIDSDAFSEDTMDTNIAHDDHINIDTEDKEIVNEESTNTELDNIIKKDDVMKDFDDVIDVDATVNNDALNEDVDDMDIGWNLANAEEINEIEDTPNNVLVVVNNTEQISKNLDTRSVIVSNFTNLVVDTDEMASLISEESSLSDKRCFFNSEHFELTGDKVCVNAADFPSGRVIRLKNTMSNADLIDELLCLEELPRIPPSVPDTVELPTTPGQSGSPERSGSWSATSQQSSPGSRSTSQGSRSTSQGSRSPLSAVIAARSSSEESSSHSRSPRSRFHCEKYKSTYPPQVRKNQEKIRAAQRNNRGCGPQRNRPGSEDPQRNRPGSDRFQRSKPGSARGRPGLSASRGRVRSREPRSLREPRRVDTLPKKYEVDVDWRHMSFSSDESAHEVRTVKVIEPAEEEVKPLTKLKAIEPTGRKVKSVNKLKVIEPSEVKVKSAPKLKVIEPSEVKVKSATKLKVIEPSEGKVKSVTKLKVIEPSEGKVKSATKLKVIEATDSQVMQERSMTKTKLASKSLARQTTTSQNQAQHDKGSEPDLVPRTRKRASNSKSAHSDEITKRQILELEMRARAIKAMLKKHA